MRQQERERFSSESFDADVFVHEVASSDAVTGGTVNAENWVAKLGACTAELDSEMLELVRAHASPMMARLRSIEGTRETLETVTDGMIALRKSVGRIERDVVRPFNELKMRTTQLGRVHETNDLLRRVARLIFAIRKLRAQMERFEAGRGGGSSSASGSGGWESSVRELCKAAYSLRQIEDQMRGGELTGVNIIDAESEWVRATARKIRAAARSILFAGMKRYDQTEVGGALQVFYNLSSLPTATQEGSVHVVGQVVALARQVFDIDALRRGASSNATTAVVGALGGLGLGSAAADAEMQAALWQRLETLCDGVHAFTLQVWTLQRVMAKKRDAVSETRFIDVPGVGDLLTTFWLELTSRLAQEFDDAAAHSSFVRNTLVAEYPRARLMLHNVLDKLYTTTHAVAAKHEGVTELCRTYDERDALLRCLETVSLAYMAKSQQKLLDEVKLVCPPPKETLTLNKYRPSSTPTDAAVAKFVRAVQHELSSTRSDVGLSTALCRGVVHAVTQLAKHFFASCAAWSALPQEGGLVLGKGKENGVKSGKSTGSSAAAAASVSANGLGLASSATLSAAQKHNCTLVRLVQQLRDGLDRIPNEVAKTFEETSAGRGGDGVIAERGEGGAVEAEASVRQALRSTEIVLSNLERAILAPLFRSVLGEFEVALSHMHNENFGERPEAESASGSMPGSPMSVQSRYMRLLSNDVDVFVATFLPALPRSPAVSTLRKLLAQQLLTLYVRHVSYVRPIREAGKLKLAADMARFELIINPIAGVPLAELGFPYDELRALRPLLFIEVENMVTERTLRPSTILHHMLSRAPPTLQHPYVQAGLSPLEYSRAASAVLDDAVGIDAKGNVVRRKKGGGGGGPLLAMSRGVELTDEASVAAEEWAWAKVRGVLDSYAQRLSSGGAGALSDPLYDIMLNVGPTLMRRLKAKAATAAAASLE